MGVLAYLPGRSRAGDYSYLPFDAAGLRAIVGLGNNTDYDDRLSSLESAAIVEVARELGVTPAKAERTDYFAGLADCLILSAPASVLTADKPTVHYREEISGTEAEYPAEDVRLDGRRQVRLLEAPPSAVEARVTYQAGPDSDGESLVLEATRQLVRWMFNGSVPADRPAIGWPDGILSDITINRGV